MTPGRDQQPAQPSLVADGERTDPWTDIGHGPPPPRDDRVPSPPRRPRPPRVKFADWQAATRGFKR